MPPVQNIHKLCVDPLGENRVILKSRSDLCEVHLSYVFVSHDDAVGIPHGDAGDLVYGAEDLQRLIDHLIVRMGDRNLPAVRDSLPHIHRGLLDFPVRPGEELQIFDAGRRLYGNIRLVRETMVIDILSHAADTVAAHGSFGPVRIVHDHAKVGCLRRSNQNQAIRPDAEVAVGHIYRRRPGVRDLAPFCDVAVYIIISAAVHLGEMHDTYPSFLFCRRSDRGERQ